VLKSIEGQISSLAKNKVNSQKITDALTLGSIITNIEVLRSDGLTIMKDLKNQDSRAYALVSFGAFVQHTENILNSLGKSAPKELGESAQKGFVDFYNLIKLL
jgi:hypothetical protein